MTATVELQSTIPAVRGADVHETHSAYVFLIGDLAYKMKKPIKTDFLDFRTVDARWTACERELILNTRFAPDVYLGIAELSDPLGDPAEPLVKMRRLPESSRLSTLAASGHDVTADLDSIAHILAGAHAKSPHCVRIDREGGQEALERRWKDNLRELHALAAGIIDDARIDELELRASRYIRGRADLFEHRITSLRVVDGHGDLLADDIFCLPDGPRVLDCLDFDDRLRFVDGIDDAACLAMDLEFQGRPDAADYFLTAYLEAAADSPPRSLVDHYIAYRATVRAKVACIRFHQGHTESKADALGHIELALAHLATSAVTITVVGGLPGTGKSTLAAALAEPTGALLLSSDVVRKTDAGLDPNSSHPAEVGGGLYTADASARTYAELLRRASDQVSMGRSVIIDASFNESGYRERAQMLAASTVSELVELECRVPNHVALERIDNRRTGPSDATREVYEAMARSRDAWPSAIVIDTGKPVTEAFDAARAAQTANARR